NHLAQHDGESSKSIPDRTLEGVPQALFDVCRQAVQGGYCGKRKSRNTAEQFDAKARQRVKQALSTLWYTDFREPGWHRRTGTPKTVKWPTWKLRTWLNSVGAPVPKGRALGAVMYELFGVTATQWGRKPDRPRGYILSELDHGQRPIAKPKPYDKMAQPVR